MIVGREANDEHGSAMHLAWVERMDRGTCTGGGEV